MSYVLYNRILFVMWTATHFPAAMRSLNVSTRAKAIEIANQLLAQGHADKAQVIARSVADARQWSRCNRPRPDQAGMSTTRPFSC